MSARTSRVVLLLALMAAPVLAAAQSFGFETPANADDPALPARVRDLAERVLPVYQESNRDLYLANVAALQMALGDPAAARATRMTLRERQPRAALEGRALVDDVYVEARAIEAMERIPFADAYARAFRQIVGDLEDLTAYELEPRFRAPLEPRRENVQSVLDQIDEDSIGLRDAIALVQAWFEFEAVRSYAALVSPLLREDRDKRYLVEELAIPVTEGATVAATLVRPRPKEPSPAGDARVALLEFTLDRSARDPYEAAAHGYASVLALARIAAESASRTRVPFDADGADARAVIEWVARQPWSDGRVGVQGTRYGGFVAWSAAKQPPAALKAIATIDPMAPGIDFPNPNGIFVNSAYRWLYGLIASPADALVGDSTRWRQIDEEWYRSGRRYRDFPQLPGRASAVFRGWLNHPSYDRFWQKWLPVGAEFANIDIPVLTITGYYSAGETGAMHFFTQHRANDADAQHRLLVGPFDERALADEQRSPAPASPYVTAADVVRARYAWFDHVLEGGAEPAAVSDVVNYAIAGASEWSHEPSLAALEQSSLRFYIATAQAGGAAHRLVAERAAPFSLTQTRDLRDRPDTVVPSTGALVLTELPDGVLRFATEPFDEPVTLAGRFAGELDFTVNKYDVDLVMMLYEVRADGAYVKLFEPAFAFRASYAGDRVRRHLLGSGVRERLPFQSERFMGRQLLAGSRLMLTIGINRRPDQQINYGAGNDVSEESLQDAGAPLRIRWHEGTFIEVPSQPVTPSAAARQ